MSAWPEDDGSTRMPSSSSPALTFAEGQMGAVRIARRALRTVVEQAALGVPGVSGLANTRRGWPDWLGGPLPRHGVRVSVRDHVVDVDLFLIAQPGARMVDVGAQAQQAVGAAVEHILGMGVGAINVYIQDIA